MAESGVADARWNAERLLLLALQRNRAQIYSELNRDLSPEEQQAYEVLLQKRADHFPLAYLEGVQEFFGRPFQVDPGVLIPRPETEEIIRASLQLDLPAPARILDLGAGSGILAVTLTLEIPGAQAIALDISAAALRLLHRNRTDHVFPVRGDLALPPFLPGSFDLVVSNPPYVEEADFGQLPRETHWEPREALVTASLEQTYLMLLEQGGRLLRPGGYLIFEIGFGQLERIRSLCQTQTLLRLQDARNDFRGIPRTLVLKA